MTSIITLRLIIPGEVVTTPNGYQCLVCTMEVHPNRGMMTQLNFDILFDIVLIAYQEYITHCDTYGDRGVAMLTSFCLALDAVNQADRVSDSIVNSTKMMLVECYYRDDLECFIRTLVNFVKSFQGTPHQA